MVIQRIQSVYLLIAGVLMALVCFIVPVASVSSVEDGASASIYIFNLLPLLILNLITAVLLLISIFLFKNLKLQMSVVKVGIVLVICSAVIEAVVLYSQVADMVINWVGSALMLLFALIFSVLGLRAIKSDYKLLTSYNRLR